MDKVMTNGSTLFLRGVVWFIGLVVLALCVLAVPAGIRNPDYDAYHPILFGLYVTAIPFYYALYQTLKLLGYIDRNEAFSALSTTVLSRIKVCAIIISALFAAGMPYVYLVGDHTDSPGVIMLGFVVIFASAAIATFAAVLQKLLQNAMDIKAENDLTV